MFERVSPLAWIIIIALALAIILINISLIDALRHRGRRPKGIPSIYEITRRTAEGIRQPWKVEDQMREELSHLVANLKPTSPEESDESQKTPPPG